MAVKDLKPKEYAEGWAQLMVTIWREKMREFEVYDTGALWNSFNRDWLKWNDDKDSGSIMHTYLLYGTYVNRGVGRPRNIENSDDGAKYQGRTPKPWMSRKYAYSAYRLGEHFAAHYGQEFCRIIKSALDNKHN